MTIEHCLDFPGSDGRRSGVELCRLWLRLTNKEPGGGLDHSTTQTVEWLSAEPGNWRLQLDTYASKMDWPCRILSPFVLAGCRDAVRNSLAPIIIRAVRSLGSWRASRRNVRRCLSIDPLGPFSKMTCGNANEAQRFAHLLFVVSPGRSGSRQLDV